MSFFKFLRTAAASFCSAFLLATAASGAPTITETTSGSAGAWTYDFSVTNTLGNTNVVYYFGVLAPGTVNGTPSADWTYGSLNLSLASYGGSSYNNYWINFGTPVAAGQTVSGFGVLDTSLNPTSTFNWFAFSSFGTYTGSDFKNTQYNPLFEGTVSTLTRSAVPELGTWAMMLLGFCAIGLVTRRYHWRAAEPIQA